MWQVEEWWMFSFLMAGAMFDVLKKEIPIWYLGAGSLCVGLFQIIGSPKDWHLVIPGVITGMIFFALSKATHQGVGYGDSWMILILGGFLGIWKLLVVLAIAFLGAAVIAGIGITGNKLCRKSRIPFYPFLLIGYLGIVGW